METLEAPCELLAGKQRQHQQQHQHGELRGAFEAAAVDPGRVDRRRQRSHAEILGDADVVDRFHQHQHDARRDRRPRDRQQHAEEHAGRARAKRTSHVADIAALHQEDDAAGEIDVGVEHAGQRKRGSRRRAQVGKPVILWRVEAEQPAQRGSAPDR